MGRLIALVGALIAAALIAFSAEQTPKPRPASAPTSEFSADRAMADIRAFASTPHPIGSEANHRARDYLIGRMAALGLSPQVHPGTAAYPTPRAKGILLGGDVENLVGVLPGRDPSLPALALMAHYDSVPGSPGSADDAAGVASALEVIRAIKAHGQPARDVMLVITDGEEAGLLGADAFFNRDPAAKHIGFLINMEARGDAGRAQMFQTGAGNGEAIALMRKTAPRPSSSSLTVFIYERMPNDTDFTISRKAGIAGLNYAFIGRQFDYHSPTSTPETMDRGTLQDMGQQVLAVSRALAASTTLPAKTPDVVYSQVFGDLVIAYPPAIGWLVLAAAAALIGIGIWRARKVDAFPWLDALRGLGAGLFAVAGAITVLHFARRATGAAAGYYEQRYLLAQSHRWELAVMLLGLGFLLAAIAELARGRRMVAALPLLAGLASSLFGGFDMLGLVMGLVAGALGALAYGRPVSRAGAWTGVLILGLVLGVVLQALAAPAAYVLAWPLIVAGLGAALTGVSTRRNVLALAILGVAAAVMLGWTGGLAHASYLSLDLVELQALPILIAALVVWPLAQPAEGAPPERLIGPALLILGLAATAVVRFDDPYSARYPGLAYVQYVSDQDNGHALRYRPRGSASAWSDAVLGADGGKIAPAKLWIVRGAAEAAPAKFAPLPAAQASLTRGADGTLSVQVAPPAGARVLILNLTANTPAAIVAANGVPMNLALPAGEPVRVNWSAPKGPVTLTIRPAGPGRLEVQTAASLATWPAGVAPLPKRPANLMAFDLSDTSLSLKSYQFAW